MQDRVTIIYPTLQPHGPDSETHRPKNVSHQPHSKPLEPLELQSEVLVPQSKPLELSLSIFNANCVEKQSSPPHLLSFLRGRDVPAQSESLERQYQRNLYEAIKSAVESYRNTPLNSIEYDFFINFESTIAISIKKKAAWLTILEEIQSLANLFHFQPTEKSSFLCFTVEAQPDTEMNRLFKVIKDIDLKNLGAAELAHHIANLQQHHSFFLTHQSTRLKAT